VFTLLPTATTHGHHRAATLLALEAAASLPAESRPAIFGAEPGSPDDPPLRFTGLPSEPLTATKSAEPALVFDRTASFGYPWGRPSFLVVCLGGPAAREIS